LGLFAMQIVQDLVDYATGKRPESLLAAETRFGRLTLAIIIGQILGRLSVPDALFPIDLQDQPALKSRWIALLEACPDLQSILVLNSEEVILSSLLSEAERSEIAKIARSGLPQRLTIYT